MTNKAQMEMIGLAVVVILLALGIFFVTKFTLFREAPEQVPSFQRRQLVSSFTSTLLSSNAGCDSATFTDLLEEMQNTFTSLNCGTDLRTHFIASTGKILNETLNNWGYTYKLEVRFDTDSVLDIVDELDNGCSTKPQSEFKLFPIPSRYGPDVRVIMKICY
jgi:hypothetical protein